MRMSKLYLDIKNTSDLCGEFGINTYGVYRKNTDNFITKEIINKYCHKFYDIHYIINLDMSIYNKLSEINNFNILNNKMRKLYSSDENFYNDKIDKFNTSIISNVRANDEFFNNHYYSFNYNKEFSLFIKNFYEFINSIEDVILFNNHILIPKYFKYNLKQKIKKNFDLNLKIIKKILI